MKRKVKAGSTNVSVIIKVLDYTSTTGAGLAGLVFNSAGLVCEYRRQGQSSATAITLVTATLGTWTSGGFVADGSRGDYELSLPDAVCAAGARWAAIRLYGAASMVDVPIEIELDAVDYQDGVHFGLTALPNAAAAAAGGVPIVGSAMTLDLTQPITNVATATVGGALHGSWILAFGKLIRDATAKTLTLFGINSTSIKVHDLDDGTNPTTRTPQ